MSEQQTQTVSVKLDDLTLTELVQISQGIGHDIERLREKRAYLRRKIDERLARGERESVDATKAAEAAGDASAPGAIIEASAGR